MKCQNCGTEFEGNFCTNCGSPAAGPTAVQRAPIGGAGLVCKKCGISSISVQVVNEVKLKNKRHGCAWWIFVGWWWVPCKWLFFTLPALIFKIFSHKKQEAVNKQKTICVCQNCGYTWEK